MPATISAYHTFLANTRAKASEGNRNFSNHRGTALPISEDTATASDNAHDLGASDHRWKDAYIAGASYLGRPPYVNGVQANRIPIDIVLDGSVPPYWVDPLGPISRVGFNHEFDNDVIFKVEIPPWYVAGQRIALDLKGYPETTGSCVFYSTAYLYKPNSTNISGSSLPAAVLTSTATLANSVAGLVIDDSTLKLTDAGGLINGTTVTVGDIIAVQLKRAAVSATGDTNTGKWFMLGLRVDLNN